ncbi:MAG: hypothetical protein WA864_17470 [Acetobacteraceae bacterium]|jgi:hypothetical protein
MAILTQNWPPMAILNPDHLLAQAEKLGTQSGPGAPLQVDLRRAISAAYYAVFHKILTDAANQVVGFAHPWEQYNLVYRGIDHRRLREMCNTSLHPTLPEKYMRCVPDGFSTHLKTFAALTVGLQEKRHSADYDPAIRELKSDATLAINQAREALRHWSEALAEERRIFVLLLLFPPR